MKWYGKIGNIEKVKRAKFDSWSLAVVISELITQEAFIEGFHLEKNEEENKSILTKHLNKIEKRVKNISEFI